MDWGLVVFFVSSMGAALSTVGALVWWLAGQFKATRDLVYARVQEVIEKLEYHEKHDDARFQEVRNDVWEIRLRNARIDGDHHKQRKLQGVQETQV